MNNLLFVSIISIILGILVTFIFELILKSNKRLYHKYYTHHKIFWGYHIHHSTYGLLSFLIAGILFFLGEKDIASNFALFGIGIIIQHTRSDGKFVFIEKQH